MGSLAAVCSALLVVLPATVALPSAPLVPVEEVMRVLHAFEDIAAATPENARCVATGYNASAEYVISQLGGEGPGEYFNVEVQAFVVPIYKELSPPLLEMPGSEPTVEFKQCMQSTGWQHYVRDCDYAGARYGGQGGDVTARAAWVGDGCNAEDYSNMAAGEIALMNNAAQAEADCDNYEKAMLAESLGAGAVIFSGTMAPSRVFQATWREGDAILTIPAIGVTQSTGDILRQGGGQIARVFTDTQIDVLHTYNVFATTLAGDADRTVMAGAHLDSVPEGPGINDNGSGSATMLAIARSFEARGFVPNNRLRFAWWGAEEVGLIGSRHYVRDLVENDPGEFDRIALYLNFDMDASPNYVRRVNTCDNAPSCVEGSAAKANSLVLTDLFAQGFSDMGLPSDVSPMTGGSDFYPFVLAGIPASGLATGAGSIKTETERDEHGGFALAQLDPCYHAPCDSTANIAVNCLRETAELATRIITLLADALPFDGAVSAHANGGGGREKLNTERSQQLLTRLHSKVARPAVESCSGEEEGGDQTGGAGVAHDGRTVHQLSHTEV